MKEYCLGFLTCIEKNLVWLVRKHRGPKINHGTWNGVGGKLELGENPHTAMSREWGEECGNLHGNHPILDEWRDLGKLSGDSWEVHLFVNFVGGRGCDPTLISVNDVEEPMKWHPVERINTKSLIFYSQAVPTIINAIFDRSLSRIEIKV